jgi:hypothetical protein
MPPFSLKHVWLALTLLVLGIALVASVLTPLYPGQPEHSELTDGIMWFMGGTLIGAGLMTPLRHPFIGAAIGFVVQLILGYLLAMRIADGLNGI